jgi:hypothetical protein
VPNKREEVSLADNWIKGILSQEIPKEMFTKCKEKLQKKEPQLASRVSLASLALFRERGDISLFHIY